MLTSYLQITLVSWSSWYFNQIFADQAFHFTCVASNGWKMYFSFPGKKICTSSTSFCKSLMFQLHSFLLLKSMCCSLVPLQVLGKHFCSDKLLSFLSHIVVENWGLGFMHRCLIAPFSVFENLTFFMIFHTNVYIFCFNRMKWEKALWFFEYVENLSFG